MDVLERAIRFEELDAAGIVFFGRYASYLHEAIEHFFAPLEGGYAGLFHERGIGMPIVRLEIDYQAPLRPTDGLRIETQVAHLGRRSTTFAFRVLRAASGELAAMAKVTVVVVSVVQLLSCDMPRDVRALLEQHVARS